VCQGAWDVKYSSPATTRSSANTTRDPTPPKRNRKQQQTQNTGVGKNRFLNVHLRAFVFATLDRPRVGAQLRHKLTASLPLESKERTRPSIPNRLPPDTKKINNSRALDRRTHTHTPTHFFWQRNDKEPTSLCSSKKRQ